MYSSQLGFGLAPAHARSQRGDVCHMVAAMPFIKPKLSIQSQKPDVGMAKCLGERSGLKSAQQHCPTCMQVFQER